MNFYQAMQLDVSVCKGKIRNAANPSERHKLIAALIVKDILCVLFAVVFISILNISIGQVDILTGRYEQAVIPSGSLLHGCFQHRRIKRIQNSGILLFVDNKCNIFCLLPNHRPCDGIRRIVQLLRCRIYLFTRLLTDCFRRRICSGNCCL